MEPSRDSSRAGVVCMDHFDMTGDGVRELIVGRDDGSVQIYSYDDGEEAAPTLRYTYVSDGGGKRRERVPSGTRM